MFKNLFIYVKYPSVAGIISSLWIGSGIMILHDKSLPILNMVIANIVVSFLIAWVGFRVDKK
jgi:hypothetical protein